MLSICLPVYNEDVCRLVADLHPQCIKCKIEFEILVADDHSDDNYLQQNQKIKQFDFVELIELHENIGRSAIRNLLVEKARYDFLLFLDADTQIISESFIESYLVSNLEASVVCGGICYPTEKAPKGYRLRQKYGQVRESASAGKRSLNPYRSFMTTNYCMAKAVAMQTPFLQLIREYGHEDTLLGLDLEAKGMKILHINNPVLHLPKDSDIQFIQKTTQAVSNLVLLTPLLSQYKQAFIKIKLLRYHYWISKFKLDFIVLFFFIYLNKWKEMFFKIAPIQIILLDIYKIGLIFYLIKKNRSK